MARRAALVLCLATSATSVAASAVVPPGLAHDPDWAQFQEFVQKYNRVYPSPAEAAGRFSVFKTNLRAIEQRNAKSKKAIHGVNNFADLSKEEFRAKHTGFKRSKSTFAKPKAFPLQGNVSASSIDWRTKGAVTPVKDQGQCGSCWAFSATEQLETDYFLKYNTLPVLSPQQIVSCDTVDQGCNGGDPVSAYQYVSQAGGQDPNSVYPYSSGVSGDTGSCEVQTADFDADVAQAYYVSQSADQESQMLQQIAESPMSICVDAETWQTYQGGVITADDGCGTSLDHCVQLVGYNSAQNYWLVRNSWGTSWGYDGYIYVEQGSNVCGIAEEATIVTASQPTTKKTKKLQMQMHV